jgi:hypothetical protein
MGVRNVASLSALSSLAAATIRLRLQLCRAGCVVLTTKIKNPEQSTRSRFLSLMPQLRLFGPGGGGRGSGGDGEPPKWAFTSSVCRMATPWKVMDVTGAEW